MKSLKCEIMHIISELQLTPMKEIHEKLVFLVEHLNCLSVCCAKSAVFAFFMCSAVATASLMIWKNPELTKNVWKPQAFSGSLNKKILSWFENV